MATSMYHTGSLESALWPGAKAGRLIALPSREVVLSKEEHE
jgi:hypothetical protein